MHPKTHTFVWTAALSLLVAIVGGCPPQNSNTNDNTGGTPNDGGNPATDSLPAVSRMSPFEDAAAGTVKLRWNPIGNVDYYTVFAGTESDPPRVLSVTESQFSLDTLACVTYYWRIEAHEGSKVSSSPVWSFRTICPTDRPAVPAYPAPSHEAYDVRPAASSDGPTLQWAATKNTERYDVYLGRTTSPEYAGSTGTAAFKAPVLADGRQYYWRVVAHNSAGDTSSPLWSFVTTEVAAGPRAPAMYFPADKRTAMPTRLRFDWSDVAEAHSFEFYLGTDTNPALLATVSESEYTPPGDFKLGETYYWRVVAVNAGGRNSTPTRAFTTAETPQPPLMAMAPSPEAGATDVNTGTVLSWTPIANADAYDVYLGVNGDLALAATTGEPEYQPDSLLVDGAIYEWQVVARNGIGATPGPEWRFVTGDARSVGDDDAPGAGGGGGAGGQFTPVGVGPCDGTLTRVNRNMNGGQTIRGARWPAISADGRYVAFSSPSEDIVPGDTNGVRDAMVFDRVTGEMTRVSVTSSGGQMSAEVFKVAISGDGRYVAFTFNGGGLAIHDRDTHQTDDVTDADGYHADPAISADGRFAAFEDGGQVRVYEIQTGQIETVSVNNGGQPANGPCSDPSISSDGRFVAFTSSASNLGGGGVAGRSDAYVRDRDAHKTSWVGAAERIAYWPAISGDGSRVAFVGVPGGGGLAALDYQLYAGSSGGGDPAIISVDGNGNQSDSITPYQAAWSYDARYLTFTNFGHNLVPGTGGNRNAHIFRLDTSSGELILLDQGIGGEANDNAIQSCVTADGQTIVFDSRASNLVPDDTNGKREVFIICVP